MNKNKIAFNTHLIPIFILFIIFLGLCVSCIIGNEMFLGVLFGIFALLPVVVFAISPLYFMFSADFVEIVYNFNQREKIKWNEIRGVSLEGSFVGIGGLPHYVIAYPKKEKRLFFVVGEVSKTKKTQKLINTYYKKKIR